MKKAETGFALIEALIALVLMSLLAIAFLFALATAIKLQPKPITGATAVSLAYGQMEVIKASAYQPSTNSGT